MTDMETKNTISETDEASVEDRIRSVAHQLWELEGKPDGKAEEHWSKACEMIAAEDQISTEKISPTWLQRNSELSAEATTVKPETLNIDHMKKRITSRAA
jgi:Protein of unknown function (DUF2934)